MRAAVETNKDPGDGPPLPTPTRRAPDPGLPTPEWVRVKPLLSGICGSDLGTLSSENSPYFSPITSPPFVMGHEIFGEVVEDNSGFAAGERVVVEPALGCETRGIEPPCPYCASGRHALCLNVAKGDITPGIQTGFCRDTGGGWSRGTLVAHPSQLHRVPDAVPDEAAVAVEPLACAVHAALEAAPGPDDTSLVIGAGSVGLFTVAALRHLTGAGRIICVAKHARQREEALRLGADEVVHPKETYTTLPEDAGTEAYKPELGKPVVMGGADRVYECVGSPGTMEDAVRLTKPGGEATLVGMPAAKSSLDLTALWYKEIRLAGSYAYGAEDYDGERRAASNWPSAWRPRSGWKRWSDRASAWRNTGRPSPPRDPRAARATSRWSSTIEADCNYSGSRKRRATASGGGFRLQREYPIPDARCLYSPWFHSIHKPL